MPNAPWIEYLREEIQVRHVEQQALRQMESKDPRMPQDFGDLVDVYPGDRPRSGELQKAAEDYHNLRKAETQACEAKNFDQLAEAIEAGEHACRSSIWTCYVEDIHQQWDERFRSLLLQTEKVVDDALQAAEFSEAERTIQLIQNNAHIFERFCTSHQLVSKLVSKLDLLKQEWRDLISGIERGLDACRPGSASELFEKYQSDFPKDPRLDSLRMQIAALQEEQSKMIERLKIFRQASRWKDAERCLQKNRQAVPQDLAIDFQRWIAQEKRSRNQLIGVLALIGTSVLILLGVVPAVVATEGRGGGSPHPGYRLGLKES
jgi:hypothetical protein